MVDLEKMFEVVVKTQSNVFCVSETESISKFFGFTRRESVNPHHCPSRIVCPVPRPCVQLPGEIKTCLEHGDDQIIGRVDIGSFVEPPDRASESDGSIERLRVRDISEDPGYT